MHFDCIYKGAGTPTECSQMTDTPDTAHAAEHERKRAKLQAHAASLGVDTAFIGLLVDTFYDRIRQDDVLAPVFNNAIGENWPAHMLTMKRFWASVALNTGSYSGKPMAVHAQIPGLTQDMFPIWLSLFEQTLEDIAPSPEAREYFKVRADRIANSLKLGLFYSPAGREKV